MGRVILVCASTAALAVALGCGGDTLTTGTHTTGAGGSSGAAGATGISGASGSASSGGVTSAAGGSGSGGIGGSTSPGKASIEFTTTPLVSYCRPSACGEPTIGIKDAAGNALELFTTCTDVSCASCSQSGCPNFFCPPTGAVVTSAKMDWDGTSYVTSTCGAGTSCMELRYAKPGKYTATFCATPGKLTGPDGGTRQCVASGPAQCGQVEFDFPSATVVKGTVGP